MINKYRSVFISDLHLGTDLCQHEKLLSFLKSLENKEGTGYLIENLFLNGDIIDMTNMNHKILWSKHRTVIKKFLRMADKKINIIYTIGNHDYYLRKELSDMSADLGGIKFCNEYIHTTVKGKKYLVVHGDIYDGAVRSMPWLYFVGDQAYTIANYINKVYNGIRKLFGYEYWSLSAWLKKKVKNAVSYINNFEHIVVDSVMDRGVDGCILGHIHTPADKMIEDIHYLNSGTFCELTSCVVEHNDGRMEMLIL